MKQGTWKKGFASALFVLLFGLLLTVSRSADAQAAGVKMTRSHFALSYVGNSYISVSVAPPAGATQAEIRVYNANKKLVGKTVAYAYGTINMSLKKNKVYYYRVRPIAYGKYVGSWSPYKAFTTMQLKLSEVSKNSRNVKVKVPKVTGVKSVKVMMSKSKTSGFQSVGKVKPGKTKIFSSYRGSSFAYYTTYYVQPKVTLKNGIPCQSTYVNNFYWTKKYY